MKHKLEKVYLIMLCYYTIIKLKLTDNKIVPLENISKIHKLSKFDNIMRILMDIIGET